MTYDIIHFEALGKEQEYLESVTKDLIEEGKLPKDFKSLTTPLTLQEYLSENKIELPDLITTKTHSKLPEDYINSGNKKSVITRSAGYDHFEHLQDKINLASLREYCVDAVAQTAIKFAYCVCGNLNEFTMNTRTFERKNTKSFVEFNPNRVATVYGVGKIGHKTYQILKNNGLTVQAVDLREDELKKESAYSDVNFVSPEEAIETSDIIINVMNLTKNKDSKLYNEGYFDEEYLRSAKKNIFFINVTRGEIAPESVLLKLYKEGKILGIAADVFSKESELTERLRSNKFDDCKDEDILAAKEIIDKAISKEENFYVQPHQGFNSDLAARTDRKSVV